MGTAGVDQSEKICLKHVLIEKNYIYNTQQVNLYILIRSFSDLHYNLLSVLPQETKIQ